MTSVSHIPRPCFFWLFAAQLLLMVSHLSELPWWIWIVWSLCYSWRLLIYYGRLGFPSIWFKTLLILVGLLGFSRHYGDIFTVSGMNAVLMLAFLLKILELKHRRDVYVVIFLGYFLVGSRFLFDQGLSSTGIAMLSLTLLLSSQIALHTSNTLQRWNPLRLASLMMVQALPIMMVLFLVFPRIGPIWGLQLGSGPARVGLSDTMSPGDIGSLARHSDLAFRASFQGEIPAPQDLYWRTLVMTEFDGRTWRPLKIYVPPMSDRLRFPRRREPAPGTGRRLAYSIIAEPSQKRWLFALPWAFTSTRGIEHMPQRRLQARQPIKQRFHYELRSYLDVASTDMDRASRVRNLALPDGYNPRSRELAQQWRAAAASDLAYVERVLNGYREQPFVYTLSPPTLGRHSVDDFLFKTRRGFCEHYASSFVVLMRAAGIPARVVTGYQGGKRNPFEPYLLVYQYDAHAWAEVWLDGIGWQRVDPTAAVAPHRIELGSEQALGAESGFLAASPFSPVRLKMGWLRSLQLRADQLNFLWYRWVLSYDHKRQRSLYKDWLGQLPHWQSLLLFFSSLALPLGLLAFWMYWRRRPTPPAPADRLWHHLSRHFAPMHLERQLGEGPTHYIERLKTAYPDLECELDDLLKLYVEMTYQELGTSHTHVAQMKVLLKRIKASTMCSKPVHTTLAHRG
ncbi:MAG TPA: DUF3488 and transglutaminase-like domain-containing protein [Candidatus Entotheonella sp.]